MKFGVLGSLAMFLVLLIGSNAGCSDSAPSTDASSSATESSSSQGGSVQGQGGTGPAGVGGNGEGAAGGSSQGGGGSVAQGGAGGDGGSGPGMFNGCIDDPLQAVDHTGKTEVTLSAWTFGHKECIRIDPNTTVIWEGNFTSHPLIGGTKEGGLEDIDSDSPITLAEPASPTGNSTTSVLFPDAGTFAYFCDFHNNMNGVIWVVD